MLQIPVKNMNTSAKSEKDEALCNLDGIYRKWSIWSLYI